MALVHEFGIMTENPSSDVSYNTYEPKKYNVVSIHDDYIENIILEFNTIKCYWHSLECEEYNIAYFGITLIPPVSVAQFLSVFQKQQTSEYNEIIRLFESAIRKNKFIIHFGI